MRRSTNQGARRRAARGLEICTQRTCGLKSTVKRVVASLFAIGIIIATFGGEQTARLLAAEMHPQQAPGQAAFPAPGPAHDHDSLTESLRVETLERLKAIGAASGADTALDASPSKEPKEGSAVSAAELSSISTKNLAKKPQQKLLQDRLHMLDEHAKLMLALKKANSPESRLEHQADQLKAELKQLQAMLIQSGKNPETLLPPSFLKTSGAAAALLATEMKDAIDATTHELREWKNKAETLKSGKADQEATKKKNAAERDRVFQSVTSLKARDLELEKAAIDAQNAEQAQLARDRLLNYQWQVRVESFRLQVIEAEIALETKLADVRDLESQVCYAHIHLAERALERMRARYSTESKKQESDLTRAAAAEKSKAGWSVDPLERFRARRTAEILELEAQVLKYEQALATSPTPSFEEQQTLADRADKDFVRIKKLLEDGRVSRLDAIILNNEFRLIGPEREQLVRNEMAVVEARLQFFEDALTNVEIELLQNSIHDHYEHELIRERGLAERSSEGELLLTELERQHRAVMFRRRAVLEKLSEQASTTLREIARRLSILDQEYGFIRTQIFWVRDQDPIATGTLWQGAREFNYLVKALLRLAAEAMEPHLWGRPSAEFIVISLAVLALPVLLVKTRRTLGGMIQ